MLARSDGRERAQTANKENDGANQFARRAATVRARGPIKAIAGGGRDKAMQGEEFRKSVYQTPQRPTGTI